MQKHLNSLINKITYKSAVYPALWATAGSIIIFGFCTFTKGWIQVGLFIVGLILLLPLPFGFLWFLFTDPSYLRSEEYQLKAQSLKLLGDKDNPLKGDADDVLSLITNPSLPPAKQIENE